MNLSNFDPTVFDRAADTIEQKGWSAVWGAKAMSRLAEETMCGLCITNALTDASPLEVRAGDVVYIAALAEYLGIPAMTGHTRAQIYAIWDINDAFTDGEEGQRWAVETLRGVAARIREAKGSVN